MKNEYDALNRAVMDLERYEEGPLDERRQAALAAMLRRAGERAQTARPAPRRPGRKGWAVLAATAALACCALGVGAAARFEWSSAFAAFLGMEQGQAETLGVPGVGLGLTQPLGQGSVTLEGVLGDDHCVYLPFTVQLPEGAAPANAEGYGFGQFTFSGQEWSNSGARLVSLPSEAGGKGELRFLLMAYTAANLSGKTATLTLADLFAYPCEPEERREKALLPGRIDFVFRLDYKAQAVQVPVAAGGDVGLGVALERIELSPLSVYLGFEDWPAGFDGDAMMQVPITLHHADGTATPLCDGEGAVRYASGPENAQVVYQFGRVLDPAHVTAVEVNGRLFPAAG